MRARRRAGAVASCAVLLALIPLERFCFVYIYLYVYSGFRPLRNRIIKILRLHCIKKIGITLWVYTAFWYCLLHAPSPSLQCHVCPFLTGAQARPALLRLTQFLSLWMCMVCVSCFVQGTDSLLLCKHGRRRAVIPHFLTFLTPSLRLLSYLALHLSSRCSLAWGSLNSQLNFKLTKPLTKPQSN